MFKMYKLLGVLFFGLVFCFLVVGSNSASAYVNTLNGDTLVRGGLTVEGDLYADHNRLLFNPYGYPGVDPTIDFKKGNSIIVEMGDLFIVSDDFIHIGPNKYGSPIGKVLIQEPSEIAAKARTASGTLAAGMIEAKNMTVTYNMSVGGTLQAATFQGAFIGNADTATDADKLDGFHASEFLKLSGGTMTGDINMLGHNIANALLLDGGTLTVSSISTLSGHVSANAGLTVSGANLNVGSFNVNYITGGISTTGQAWINGGLSVNGAILAESSGNLTVNGTSNFKDAMYNSIGSVTVNDNLVVLGNSDFRGYIENSIGGELEVQDNLKAYNIYPLASDNFYDIGSFSQRFHDGYFGNVLNVGANTDPGDTYTTYSKMGLTTYNSNLFLRSETGSVTIDPSSGAIFLIPGATGTGTSYSRSFYPYNDASSGTYDLGAFGQAWRNLYLSNYFEIAGGNFSVNNDGDVYVNGTMDIGDDTIIEGNLSTENVAPRVHDTYNIGSDGYRYSDMYLSATGGLYVGANTTNYMSYGNDGVNSYGSYGTSIDSTNGNTNISAGGYVQIDPSQDIYLYPGSGNIFTRNVVPNTSGDYSLGSLSRLWLNGHFYNLFSQYSLDVNDGTFVVDSTGIKVNGTMFTADQSGNTHASGTLNVLGIVTANGGITVDGTTFNANALNSGGNDFSIYSGAANINFSSASVNLISNNALNVGDGYAVGGSGTSLYPNGSLSMNGTLQVDGLATLDGGIDVGGISAFTADTSGNVFAAGTLEVDGLAKMDLGLNVTGPLMVSGDTDIRGFVQNTTGAFEINDDATIADTLIVDGLAEFDGGFNVDGVFTVANTTGDVATTGYVDFSGATYLKVPVLGSAPACAAVGDRGSIYYNTTDYHTYICVDNGVGGYAWDQLDN